jgi:hypothetical protein
VAFGLRPRAIDRSFKTARVNAPAGREGFADGLDLHENIRGRRTAESQDEPRILRSDPNAAERLNGAPSRTRI